MRSVILQSTWSVIIKLVNNCLDSKQFWSSEILTFMVRISDTFMKSLKSEPKSWFSDKRECLKSEVTKVWISDIYCTICIGYRTTNFCYLRFIVKFESLWRICFEIATGNVTREDFSWTMNLRVQNKLEQFLGRMITNLKKNYKSLPIGDHFALSILKFSKFY